MKFNLVLNKDFSIKVSSHIIYVKFLPPDHDIWKTGNPIEDQEVCHGMYVAEDYTIYIRSTDPESMKLSTFYHELFHVFEHFYTFSLDHKELNLVAECLTQTLLDNFKVQK